ncbi:MAG TPA: thiol reductase thioredoxin [Candidatus Aminicenantes bacterium]|nr:thiol reductase thioredoxin [Candidatus Aminicenantes bacterium]
MGKIAKKEVKMNGKKVKVSCFNCGQTNNYPLEAEDKKVICGRCHSPLPRPGDVLEVNPDQAFSLISRSSLPVLIDFYSHTCPPCQMMAPFLERLARRRAGELMVIKIEVDRYPEMAAQFGIQSVPTFAIFHRNSERGRISGAMPETDLALWVAKLA